MACREGLFFISGMPPPTLTKLSLIKTTHTIHHPKSTSSADSPTAFGHRIIRIICTDADATDSSSDSFSDEESEQVVRRRVKRYVKQINIDRSPHVQSVRKPEKSSGKKRRFDSPESDVTRWKKFRCVRRRPWGLWAAEIRDSARRKRVSLRTYDTAEEAATVYDRAAVMLKGPAAVANFPTVTEGKTEGAELGGVAVSSPTSVLRYEYLPTLVLRYEDFTSFSHGDVNETAVDGGNSTEGEGLGNVAGSSLPTSAVRYEELTPFDGFSNPRPFLIENGSEPLQLPPTAQEDKKDDGIGSEGTGNCAMADQAQFNSGCLEERKTREKNPGGERRDKKANGVRIAIPLDDILQAKGMCLKDAANHLKVSISKLKTSCRKYGIPRWPPRNEHKLIRQSLPKETPAVVDQMGIPQLTSHTVPSNQALMATVDTNSVVEKEILSPQFLPTAQKGNFDAGFSNDEAEAIGVGVEGTREAVMEEAQLNSGGFGNNEAETIGVGIEVTWEVVMEEAQLNSRCLGKKGRSKVNTPGGERSNNRTTGVKIAIPKEDILQTKGMRLIDAAKHLEVSKSTLKRICRGYGIYKWPPCKEQELISQSRANKSPTVVDQEQIPQLNPDTLLPSNQVSATSDTYKVKVKVKCEEGTIKFRLSSPWRKVELEQEVKKRLPFEAGTYNIEYKDEDEELILINCDDDLEECISSSSPVDNRSIELFLKLK